MNKIILFSLVFVFWAYAEINNDSELLAAINTPDGLNYCIGGKTVSFWSCVRRYFPSCDTPENRKSTLLAASCIHRTTPVNVSTSDRQRHVDIEAYKRKKAQTPK